MLKFTLLIFIIVKALMSSSSQAIPMYGHGRLAESSSRPIDESAHMSADDHAAILAGLDTKYPNVRLQEGQCSAEEAYDYWTERGIRLHEDKFYYCNHWPEPYRTRYEKMWNKKKGSKFISKVFRRRAKYSAEPVDYEELIPSQDDYDSSRSRSHHDDSRYYNPELTNRSQNLVEDTTDHLANLALDHAARLVNEGFGAPQQGWQNWIGNKDLLDEVYSTCFQLLQSSGYDFDSAKYLVDHYGNVPVAQTLLVDNPDHQWAALSHLLTLQSKEIYE